MSDARTEAPEELVPLEDLYVPLPGGREVAVRRYHAELHGCPEKPAISLDRAYSAKPLVLVEKQAVFPELAVLALLKRKGWDGAWADTSHRKFFDKMPNQSKGISLGAHAGQVLTRIAQYAEGGRAGCWDLVLWADRTVAFAAVIGGQAAGAGAGAGAEARGAPTLGEGRTRWLAAAVKSGLSASQFVVVEWGYRRVAARRKRRG